MCVDGERTGAIEEDCREDGARGGDELGGQDRTSLVLVTCVVGADVDDLSETTASRMAAWWSKAAGLCS